MKLYHTETQEDYDALMVELEEQGCKWLSGRKPTSWNDWSLFGEETCIRLDGDTITQSFKSFYDGRTPITKYKTKGEDKMKFTKDNIYKLFSQYRKCADYSLNDLQDEILELDDAPEKVVVPKFVAEFYESIRDNILYEKFKAFETTTREDVSKWYMDFKGRHNNNRANAQETIAKMDLYGYTVEPEQLYYIPLPDLEMLDGSQQVLSKSKNGNRYFASRPDKKLKQRYTKEELEQVPEIYKPYAKPIEEENE